MFTLILRYQDDRIVKFFHVTKVEYVGLNGLQSLTGDELFNHYFSFDDPIHIFSDTKNVMHSLEKVVSLEVVKE